MATAQAPQESVRARPVLTTIGLLALVIAGVIGADPYRVRERLVDSIAPTDEAPLPAQVGWRSVVTLRGIGTTAAAPFSIDEDAVR